MFMSVLCAENSDQQSNGMTLSSAPDRLVDYLQNEVTLGGISKTAHAHVDITPHVGWSKDFGSQRP